MRDYSQYHPHLNDVMVNSGELIYKMQLETFEGRQVDIDGEECKALVRYHQSPINEFHENRRITVWKDIPLSRGSVVTTLDDNREFLVVSEVNENALHRYGLMRETNLQLRWLDEDENLIVMPSIVHAKTLYTTGIKNENVMYIPNGMVGILLPFNDITKKLQRNQNFVFNKTKYRLTFYNEIEDIGLVTLICEENPPSKLDDLKNNIADRWAPDGRDRLKEEDKKYLQEPIDDVEVVEPEGEESEDEVENEIESNDEVDIFIESSENNIISVWDTTRIYTNADIENINGWTLLDKKANIVKEDGQSIYIKPRGIKYMGSMRVVLNLKDGRLIEKELLIKNI